MFHIVLWVSYVVLLLARCCSSTLAECSLANMLGSPELDDCQATNLVQVGGVQLKRRSAGSSGTTCAALQNRESHFTVQIEVGTPGQKLDVVADTGSDAVIVASCACSDLHRCRTKDKCFRGTNRSSTFSMQGGGELTGYTEAIVMTFGSGQIEALVATDMVQVGNAKVLMEDGLLLMIDQALSIVGPFEGILGLGIPKNDEITSHGYYAKGFLEAAHISRFSICFNRESQSGSDGVLRLGTSTQSNAMGSVGQVHWGLDFRGISVGSVSAPVQFCSPADMAPGQATPCGAIPDSGTTVMVAPVEHLKILFAEICNNWSRCREMLLSSKYEPHHMFQILLLDCMDWMNDTEGLNELPPLNFHVAGADGKEQVLELAGSSYVLSTMESEMAHVTKHLFGIIPVQFDIPTGRRTKVCIPAFSTLPYETLKNGPIWIFGLPIFYQYQVGYDLSADPPAVSFSAEACGSCDEEVALVTEHAHIGAAKRGRVASGKPWEIHRPLRLPKRDTSFQLGSTWTEVF